MTLLFICDKESKNKKKRLSYSNCIKDSGIGGWDSVKLSDIKEDKSLWEKQTIEGVGKVLLVEESYYDGIVQLVAGLEDKPGHMYEGWIDTIRKQLKEFSQQQTTDLFLLRNHLRMVLRDVEAEIERQGLKETE